ncbi:hypothetical protein LTR49_028620, partial [Elasticomyces elasticus]
MTTRFGHRLCLILAATLSFAGNLGGGFAHSYGALMVARVFSSIGVSIAQVLGASVAVGLFAPERRAAKMNIWSVMVTIGPAIGGLVGGFLVAALGWRWALYLNAISTGAEVVAYILTYPETQWVPSNPIGLKQRMGIVFNNEYRIRPLDFIRPLWFVQSPAMVIMFMVFGLSFGLISPGLAITLPAVFVPLYGFGARALGLIFIAYIVGTLIGGQIGGRFSDVVANRYATKCIEQGKPYRYEYRLLAVLPGYFLVIAGFIIYGVTLQEVTHWAGPVIGYGIVNCGLQVIMNVINTYCVDCYTTNALSITVFLGVGRQVIGFTTGFWIPPLIAATSYGLGIAILAIICFVFY